MRIYIYRGMPLSLDDVITYFGDTTTRPYARKLYRGEITIDDVPEDLRETVQIVVNNRTERWGAYEDQPVSTAELRTFVQEVADDA